MSSRWLNLGNRSLCSPLSAAQQNSQVWEQYTDVKLYSSFVVPQPPSCFQIVQEKLEALSAQVGGGIVDASSALSSQCNTGQQWGYAAVSLAKIK